MTSDNGPKPGSRSKVASAVRDAVGAAAATAMAAVAITREQLARQMIADQKRR
jgi:hypothetical protein